MKETNSNNKIIKTIIAVIAVVIITIIGFIFLKSKNTTDSQNIQEQIVKLEDKEASLRAKKDVIFRTEGFTEEYYKIDNEISRVQDEIWDLESQQRNNEMGNYRQIFMVIPLLVFVLIISIFISRFAKISKMGSQGIIHPSEKTGHDIEKMASMMGKVAAEMAKEMNPEYKSLKCPNCGANLPDDVDQCEYCDAPLIKVAATKK